MRLSTPLVIFACLGASFGCGSTETGPDPESCTMYFNIMDKIAGNYGPAMDYYAQGSYRASLRSLGLVETDIAVKGLGSGAKALVHNLRGLIYTKQGKWDDALAEFQTSFELDSGIDNKLGMAMTLEGMGQIYLFCVQLRRGQGSQDDTVRAEMLAEADRAAVFTGLDQIAKLNKAKEKFKEAYDIYRTCDDDFGSANVSANIAVVFFEQDKFNDARAWFASAYEYYSEIDNRASQAAMLWELGRVYQEEGNNLQRAMDYYESARERFMRENDIAGAMQCYASIASLFELQGNTDAAEQAYADASMAAIVTEDMSLADLRAARKMLRQHLDYLYADEDQSREALEEIHRWETQLTRISAQIRYLEDSIGSPPGLVVEQEQVEEEPADTNEE